MGILSDVKIKKYIGEGKLKIEPFSENLLSPASYDLRAGQDVLRSVKDRERSPIVDLKAEKAVEISTGEFIEIMTLEKLTLPLNICGRMGLRSYYTRKGLILFSGPQIDPGFDGQLTVSLFNTGPRPIVLKYEDPFCTIELNELETPASKPYSGPYQHQTSFPSENIEFIVGARGVTLHQVIERITKMSRDIWWMKWILLAILGALIGAIISKGL